MEKIVTLINNGEWQQAQVEFEKLSLLGVENTDEYAICGAEIYLALQDFEKAFSYIRLGLQHNYENYELYYILGKYYARINCNQAALCFEMATFYAKGSSDHNFLAQEFENYKKENSINISPISIVIISYNSKIITQNCIQSIRLFNPSDSYELIVVDNASTDGILEWLTEQDDIHLISNNHNTGFAFACNQGVEIASKGNDIFFLNNDTLVPPNAIFWLRMGLYENEKVGATGSITNYAGNGQMVNEDISSFDEWFDYGTKINVPMQNPYEKKLWLIGFAMLVKREVLNKVGLFDLRFGKGNFEDNDLGLRILSAGYTLHLCHNSFIVHFGSMGFKQNPSEEYNQLMIENHQKLIDKWNQDVLYYAHARTELIDLLSDEANAPINVLEIGCGAGATLAKILYRYPNASVKGVELDRKIAVLGSNYLDIRQGNIESDDLNYEKGSFDYIIFGDVLEHLLDPDAAIQKVLPLLKSDGHIIASIPNIQHVSVLLPLLQGKFEYKNAGILDNTNIRFFTLESILNMMQRNSLEVDCISYTRCEEDIIEYNNELYYSLTKLLGEDFEKTSKVYQYLVKTHKQ